MSAEDNLYTSTMELHQPDSQISIDLDNEPNTFENEITQPDSNIQEDRSQYFDASSMAPLSPTSVAAIARLRAYKPPPFAVWDRLPLSRRAAVLILLFADRRGDLRVVITMRATTLRNYSGHAAFPGGKADTLEETPWEIARREAWEEIGLPLDDSKVPPPFRIEHLCEIPFSLAKTALAVRPCVAFLHSNDSSGSQASSVEETMIPRLDPKEVAAVFSAPFHNFLRAEDEVALGQNIPGKRSDWYNGAWTDWHEGKWRMHNFHVPINDQNVSKPKIREGGQAAIAEQLDEEEEAGMMRYKVWGMTARMLVDAARVAYDEDPEFEHDAHIGDERMIGNLERMGKLGPKVPGGPDLTESDLKTAISDSRKKSSGSGSKI
ncbi:uncharacterized protein BP5553_06207 [Venustampulla echinocandica]|uniref:Nudix hydrolase domain-containing protein n=1 Tax=Venustampulla echinocandica TaxID=2656787 RepID=A0A370TMW3_9HELO|nr:uncharacterized protein BP5553_06207 [Venustampulla echinocandica]RDL36855.1 hypothetical protein BP5553_06207 [Venustampulla echinocandica]